jgi:pantetheine-phosphate adenylyltransferase
MAQATQRHHLAVYPGSFDPPTLGHLDVLERARSLFDEVIVAVGRNPEKADFFPVEERVALLEPLVREIVRRKPDLARVSVATYSGLTVDYARSVGASGIIRGIRNVTDLASECQLAITNRQVAAIETVFVVTGEEYAFLSSSLIRQIAAFSGSTEKLRPFVPPNVAEAIQGMMADPSRPLRRLATELESD